MKQRNENDDMGHRMKYEILIWDSWSKKTESWLEIRYLLSVWR